jgi:LmbE family N-acetylglucosaminyl deacetylase
VEPTGTASLPTWTSVLVVVAHPDDESFGLGAVISRFVGAGAAVSVLCLTRGEASTLHGVDGDLATIREAELTAAADALGVSTVRLLDYPDGGLGDVDLDELADLVREMSGEVAAEGLLAFDSTGVTGHPDHVRATAAAVTAARARGIGVLGWTLPESVAHALRAEFGLDFRGRQADEIDLVVPVDRGRQRRAVGCHPSQAVPGSALWRRLELEGDVEHLRWLQQTASDSAAD